MSKFSKITIVFLVCILMLSACKTTNEAQSGKISVLYWNQEMLDNDYGRMFSSKNPNIEVEVIPLNDLIEQSGGSIDELLKLVDEAQPDVIFTRTYEEYLKYAESDRLEDLEKWTSNTSFDIESFNPAILSLLRKNDSNRLYGLAPMYSGLALFFNKDMFDQMNVDYPQDQSSWQDIIQLAMRFTDKDTYGLSLSDSLYGSVTMIGRTHGLNVAVSRGEELWVMNDSEKWADILELLKTSIQSGAVYNPGLTIDSSPEVQKADPFNNGQAAMTVASPGLIQYIENSKEKFKLGIVTVPVDPSFPDRSYTLRVNQIFGINSKSSNKELAWKFVEFVNSEEVAKVKSRSIPELYSRMTVAQEIAGYSLEPFRKLNHDDRIRYQLNFPPNFNRSLNELVTREVGKLIEGSQNSQETVKNIQDEGELLFKMLREKEKE